MAVPVAVWVKPSKVTLYGVTAIVASALAMSADASGWVRL